MLGKTHKYVGACCGIIVAEQLIQNNINPENLIYGGLMISSGIIGALLLDIDKKGTTISNKLPSFFSSICSTLFGHRGATHAPIIWILICLGLIHLNSNLNPIIRAIFICVFACFTLDTFIKFICKHIKKIIRIRKVKQKAFILSTIIGVLSSIYFYNLGNNVLENAFVFIVIGLFVGVISHIILDSFNPLGTPLLFPITNRKFHIMSLSEKYGFIFSFMFTIFMILSTINLFL